MYLLHFHRNNQGGRNKINGDNLSELLRIHSDQLEPNCLIQALTAAVSNDNHYNVGKLIMKGADKVKEALKQSVDEKKPHAKAMLLLVVAAMEVGTHTLCQHYFRHNRR